MSDSELIANKKFATLLSNLYMYLQIMCILPPLQIMCIFTLCINYFLYTASRLNLAHLGQKKLTFDCFKCSFVGFFLLKYVLTQVQVIKVFY